MNEMTIYFSLAGVLGVVLIGLLIYARFEGKSLAAATGAKPSGLKPLLMGIFSGPAGPSPARQEISPSEQLVDVVDIIDGRFFLTASGSLVALFHLRPLLTTTGATPENLAANFVSIVHALEPKSTVQIVQLPMPSSVGDLTDRYARACYRWRGEIELAQATADAERVEIASNRYYASAQLGAQILEIGGRAPRRESFIVLSKSLGLSGRVIPEKVRKGVQELELDAGRLAALFESGGLPIDLLLAKSALPVLWNAYNPEQGALALVDQEGERFAGLMQTGQASPPATALSSEQIDRVLANPREELRRLLAPPELEERQSGVRFRESEILLYFANDFHSGLPAIRRLLGPGGKFAHCLYVSYFITSPPPEEMARLTRRASTAKQALQTLAARAGALPSYRQAEEVRSIEQARAGAETETNPTRLVGLYLGLLVSTERRETDRMEFESILHSAGVELIPAHWLALDAWRTLLPLGQRIHRYEDRNLFSDNLAPLNPLTAAAWFDPQGEMCGFTVNGENTGMPVAIRRERGTDFIPSDAVVGAPGSGKSYTLKLWVTDWIARGRRCFVVDPKLEFGPLTRALGGRAISLRGSRGFNLLHFESFPLTPGTEVGESLARLVFEDNLAAVEALYTLARSGRGRASGVERNLLTNALKRAMLGKGMNSKDPATWRPNLVCLADVYQVLIEELAEQDPETVRPMAAVLEQYAVPDGQYFEQYNTPNDFSLDADLVTTTFGLGQLSADETAKSITAHFALRIAVNHAVRSFLLSPEPVPFHIVIDEASQLLTTPALVSSAAAMLSLLSAYGISVHLAFQDMQAIERADSLGAAENAASMNTLSAVLPAYWLFHQEPASAEAAARLLHLPSDEVRRIVQNRVGHCVLVFPSAALRLPLAIQVPEPFRDLFRTDPGSMRRIVEEGLAQPQNNKEPG